MDTVEHPHSRSGTAVRRRGRTRVEDILTCAQGILVREGIAALTTRRVARELGISVGNLAYYFASKDDLLQALISHVIGGYDRELQREAASFPDQPAERFKAFLRYMIEDARRPEVHAFFYQLWGLSSHDPAVAATRDDMYTHFAAQTTDLLRGLRPGADRRELEMLAIIVLNSLEGLHVLYGSGRRFLRRYRGFDEATYRHLLATVGID